jgi:uncharacterized protein (TIGR02246 family)
MRTAIVALALGLAAAAPAAADELTDELLANEADLWRAWAAGDGDVFRGALVEDAAQIVAGAGLVEGRETIASNLGGCVLNSFDFQDGKVRHLSADVVLLTYTATQDASCDGTALPPKVVSSSVYVQRGGEWLNAFYQETPVE